MTPRHNFIIGITLVIVAFTLALAMGIGRQKSSSNPTNDDGMLPSVRNSPSAGGSRFQNHGVPRSRSSRAPTRAKPEPWRVEAGSNPHLAASAKQVERYAKSRVERLTKKLGLDEVQQQRIFPLIARSSQSYDPAMRIEGGGLTTGAGMTDAEPLAPEESQGLIEKELTPEQRMGWVENSIDDLVLWQEIIANLSRQLDQAPAPGTPAVSTGEPPPEAPGPLPPSRGGRNLFE